MSIRGTCLTISVLALLTSPGAAQERDPFQQWIHDNHKSCCDHRDCSPATVSYTIHGWHVHGTLWPVPIRDVIPWPFNVPYACLSGRRVRCLFLREGM